MTTPIGDAGKVSIALSSLRGISVFSGGLHYPP
jgi:hypothetical protein